mgnify:CR=1 FL=1
MQLVDGCEASPALAADILAFARTRLASYKVPRSIDFERELPRLTPRTTVDLKAFRAVVAQVRADDFAVASEEHELGVHALAVPLRNMTWQGAQPGC